ncbi:MULTISPECIES: membrane-bound PQQ-dependent dehydrogenase, glucose/quinate/shikimate family [Halomonadaceae]|uniref:Membrane-bound PQQ-dependent dehydrogenase, glucose/quinate/shikimate family n=1 Tax=Vreelandella glaciei TaxID=186761 RepID=A0A7Z0LTJ9_9GAMM|nr:MULTISPECIES: membrane-bound PQQ-dependent dehydrogenase, glucose/quinate/shikimate family [Halomonas]NYS78338.1 membrane-bound PQQ-dependent dehydrogenase, glucose/quinate/shikimate family [Halomonas glaciei]|tara:strand:- start:3752 stop:6181 length:2430 start_codon:yes stop_codon:yes gene_type:complete
MDAPQRRRFAGWALFALAVVLFLLSLPLVIGGGYLLYLGGSPYFLLAGIAILFSAVLICRDSPWGVWLYVATVAVTFAWSLWEIAGKGWMPIWQVDLMARVGVLLALMIMALLLLPAMYRRLGRYPPASIRYLGVIVLAGFAAALGLLLLGTHTQTSGTTADVTNTSPTDTPDSTDWVAYGGTNSAQRFSPAAQITPANASQLEKAWEFNTGDEPHSDATPYAFQNTPLKVNGSIYVCTQSNQIFALDPSTGEQQWHFDPQVEREALEHVFSAACRSLAYYEASEEIDQCAHRILMGTMDGRLMALDAEEGTPCNDFGEQGTVDLYEHMDPQAPGYLSNTSGPTVVNDVVVVGHQVTDNQRRDGPSGAVRAYDAVTGERRWTWDSVWTTPDQQPDEGEVYPRGTPNVWSAISADEDLGLVYLPTGNSTNDQFGGDRQPAEDEFTSTLVAVDAQTGEVEWKFTTVIHDLWDYDLGAQPALIDYPTSDDARQAVVQATKYGQVFVFDRATGEPLSPVEERPVPQGTIEGDWTSEVQHFSPGMPSFGSLPGQPVEHLTGAHTWGATPVDHLYCRIQYQRMRYEGMFTPPTLDGGGMLQFPGILGGINWGSASFDDGRNLMIVNNNRMPSRVVLYPRDEADEMENIAPIGDQDASYIDQQAQPMRGAPVAAERGAWLSPIDMPCTAPPWGFISATDLNSGEIVWSRPLGTSVDQGPFGIPSRLKMTVGAPTSGGPVATRGGMTFIGATMDDYLRGFDSANGRMVWEQRLPAGGQATPMTYMHEGRQYVVIAAGGSFQAQTTLGDSVVAYALPE